MHATLISESALYRGPWKCRSGNAGVEIAGVHKVWKAVRRKYSQVSANWGGVGIVIDRISWDSCCLFCEVCLVQPRDTRIALMPCSHNAFVSRALTKCTIKDEAVLIAARLSTCCCVCILTVNLLPVNVIRFIPLLRLTFYYCKTMDVIVILLSCVTLIRMCCKLCMLN